MVCWKTKHIGLSQHGTFIRLFVEPVIANTRKQNTTHGVQEKKYFLREKNYMLWVFTGIDGTIF